MAIDVKKLIEKARADQEAARSAAATAAKEAARNKAEAEVAALSKKQLAYANSLKTSRNNYEAQLKGFAAKMAVRELNKIEEKEFNDILNKYNSVNSTIDAALKKANDILVEARRGKATNETSVKKETSTSTGSGADDARLGIKSKTSGLSGSSGTVDTAKVSGSIKSPEQVAADKAKADAAKKKKSSTVFTEPMTISGQVSTTPTATTAADSENKTLDEVLQLAYKKYNLVDSIFKSDPSLRALLLKAILGPDGKLGTGDEMGVDEWKVELANTDWFKSNADAVQKRGFYQSQYNELLGKIDKNDPNYQAKVDQLNATSTYGRGLAATKRYIEDLAIKQGAVLSPEAALKMAQEIYDLGNENNASLINSYVRSNIKYVPGTLLGGQAGQDLAALKQTAAANGIDFDKAFGGNITGWLQKIDQGESVETYKQIIRNAAKMGLPDKVGALLDKGVDLETIYAPYRNIMASTLEINPQSITLSDPTLRAAIGPDKEQTLYDYERALRKDNRWQYTNNARQETSDAVTKVLQDFGFRG